MGTRFCIILDYTEFVEHDCVTAGEQQMAYNFILDLFSEERIFPVQTRT